jgi:hypothetical protein
MKLSVLAAVLCAVLLFGETSDQTNSKLPAASNSLKQPNYMLLIARPKPSRSEEAEAFFKSEVLPALARESDLLEVQTFAMDDATNSYVVLLRAKANTVLSPEAAITVLSRGKDLAQTLLTLRKFTTLFDHSVSLHIVPRPDLSISRSSMGSASRRSAKE